MSAAPSVHEFGRFRLDAAERLLVRSGQPVSLTPKAFDLLVYLVERHGRLVTKQELMRALWPETFVEEANLTYTVSALRKALGEREGQDEQLIQTVPTRGYRFIAPVTHDEALPVSSPPVDRSRGGGDGHAAAASPPRTRERVAWIVAAVLGVGLCAMVVLYLRAVPPAPDPLEFPIAPPETWVFNARMPAPTFQIAPDGQHLAVVASSEGVAMLWVRPIAKPAWRQLPETQGAEELFWSPDSQSLGFFANDQLKTVRVSGGAPVIICEARVGQAPSGAWSHNGVILFGGLGPLRKVGVNPGKSTPAATLGPGEIAHRWPSFLPDGEHFLFLAEAVRQERTARRIGRVYGHQVPRPVRIPGRLRVRLSVVRAQWAAHGAALRHGLPSVDGRSARGRRSDRYRCALAPRAVFRLPHGCARVQPRRQTEGPTDVDRPDWKDSGDGSRARLLLGVTAEPG